MAAAPPDFLISAVGNQQCRSRSKLMEVSTQIMIEFTDSHTFNLFAFLIFMDELVSAVDNGWR